MTSQVATQNITTGRGQGWITESSDAHGTNTHHGPWYPLHEEEVLWIGDRWVTQDPQA